MKKITEIIFFTLICFCSVNKINGQTASCPTITAINVTPPSCFGFQNGSVSIDYIGGSIPYNISWGSPISLNTTTGANTHSISGIGSGVYNFTVTEANRCSVSNIASVSQPTTLVLSVAATNTDICFGQGTQLYATASGGTPPYSYTWSPISLTGAGPHFVTPSNTTIYTVNLNDANNCNALQKNITISVKPPLSVTAATYTYCEGDIVTMIPMIQNSGNGGPYDFTWSTGVIHSGVNSSSISVIATIPSPTFYTVTVNDGCTIPQASATFTVNAQVCTEIEELTNTSFSIYPNPVNNFLNVENKSIYPETIIELYNSIGQRLELYTLNNTSSVIDLENFPKGIYFLQIKNIDKIIHKTTLLKLD